MGAGHAPAEPSNSSSQGVENGNTPPRNAKKAFTFGLPRRLFGQSAVNGERSVAKLCRPETISSALADIPQIDHLVLLAGSFVVGKILEAEVDYLKRAFDERIWAAIHTLRTLGDRLAKDVVQGRAAIADVAGKLLEQFGPTFRFTPTGTAVGHHGLGLLQWQAGPDGGAIFVTGADVAEVVDGRIARLWVLLNPQAN